MKAIKQKLSIIKLLGISLVLILSACSSSKPLQNKQEIPHSKGSSPFVVKKITNEFGYWRGTPYKYGGNTTDGVDCSGLVKRVYKDSFNIQLPRVTIQQVKKGIYVKRKNLQVGDLVFFKVHKKGHHVGIYVGDNKFMHGSSSHGVIISSLNNVYWKPKYWQARRIVNK